MIRPTGQTLLTPKTYSFPYTPHKYQLLIHTALCDYRFVTAVAHRRFGKTECAIACLLSDAIATTRPDAMYGYIAPYLKQAKQIAWRKLKRYVSETFGRDWKAVGVQKNEAELWVQLPNGARIQLFGADNADAIRGLYFDGVVIDEIADMKGEVWNAIIRPALADRKGWALLIGTPKGMNQLYKFYQRGLSDPLWKSLKFSVGTTNLPWLPPDEIKALEADMTESMYAQEMLCVPSGAMVYTNRGQVPIEKIESGDIVLSHSGRFRPVKQTHSREYEGTLVEFVTAGDAEPVTVTPNHPVRIYKQTTQKFAWVRADEVKPEDMLVRPRREPAKQSFISEELVKIIGWYICEGSARKQGFNLAININEISEAEEIRDCLNKIDVPFSEQTNKNVRQFVVGSSPLSDLLVSQCGRLAHNKRIPWELVAGHEDVLINTLMLGDGCAFKVGRNTVNAYVTVSKNLAYDVQMLAGMFGYRAGISRKAGGKNKILDRTVNCREKYEIRFHRTSYKKTADTFPARHGIAVKIRSIKNIPYQGMVHNFEVADDHSYVVNGRVVHNCDFQASSDDVLFKLVELEKAANRQMRLSDINGAARVIGLDVAGPGKDSSCMSKRQGLMMWPQRKFKGMTTPELCDVLAHEIIHWQADAVIVDNGYGFAVVEQMHRRGFFNVYGVDFGGKPSQPQYANKKTEMMYRSKKWIDTGGKIPKDEELFEEAGAHTFKLNEKGKLEACKKDDVKDKIKRSPDKFDSFILTNAFDVLPLASHPFANVKEGDNIMTSLTMSNVGQAQDYDPYE